MAIGLCRTRDMIELFKNRWVARPPAKINLHLRILGRRDDGYHEIETVFQAIDFRDRLEIELIRENEVRIEVAGADLPRDDRNLCVRAARLFAEHCREFTGCQIRLKKNIPEGAGLGGGSSDAAATLLGLNRLFGNILDEGKLHSLARQLGADVPFFLKPGLAIGRGIGDQLEYVNTDWKYWVLLLLPTYKISTRWAYESAKLSLTSLEKNVILKGHILQEISPKDFKNIFVNDFEKIVFGNYPELRDLKASLLKMGAFFASMSGTGSTIYGLFENCETARRAAEHFRNITRTELVQPVGSEAND